MIFSAIRISKLFSLILIFQFIYAQHFEVTIGETGESTLFIFQDIISTLEPGDELGIFDSEGLVDATGALADSLIDFLVTIEPLSLNCSARVE